MFADQAAIAFSNARLLQAEREKSAELERANTIIASLSEIASRLGEALDEQKIYQTIGEELKKLALNVEIGSIGGTPVEFVVQYSSIESFALRVVEELLGNKVLGFRIPLSRAPQNMELLGSKPTLLAEPVPIIHKLIPAIPLPVLKIALNQINITQRTPLLSLPLRVKDRLFGSLLVWGVGLRQNDVAAFSVFANQVAVTLENARLYRRLERQATQDELTGLSNRRGFFMLGEQQLRVAQRAGAELVLIFIDVDGLKRINDTLGHAEGDRALMETGEVLRNTFRSADIPARISGDEFAVLAYPTRENGIETIVDRLAHEVARINARPEHAFQLSLSIGHSTWQPGQAPITLDELLARADTKMYVEKRGKTGTLPLKI
jgi:diguanylate cyclase (GGDEF)-like protein